MPQTQTYKTHRRFMPAHHFFVMPVLVINLFIQIWRLIQNQTLDTGWAVVVALALVTFGFTARIMALTAQNRVIRLEERMRLARLMPAEEHPHIDKLSARHLVGLRFASDPEAPDLARRCISGELQSAGDVKKNVSEWRPDYLRV